MRRKDREITDFQKMLSIMKACDVCRLGFVDGNEAYIVPMNFGYSVNGTDITLFFHCASEGRKIDLIPSQSLVSFEMDTKHELVSGELGCDYTYLYQCIMGRGKLEAVSEEEKTEGLKRIMLHYTGKEKWEFDEKYLKAVTVLKICIKDWSCKEH